MRVRIRVILGPIQKSEAFFGANRGSAFRALEQDIWFLGSSSLGSRSWCGKPGLGFPLARRHLCSGGTLLLLDAIGVILAGGTGCLAIHSSWCHLMVGCQGTGLGCELGRD